MRIQLISDLHLETEQYAVTRADHAELLLLAGDIDSSWAGLDQFRDWPVPVVLVAGNHEFDGRDLSAAWPHLRERCAELNLRLLECERMICADAQGRRIRFLGTVRWCDFDLFGSDKRAAAMRAGAYFAKVMRATLDGHMFDAEAVRTQARTCREWLESELRGVSPKEWDATVVITHFGPSLLSADPRYGAQLGTASFCNADDDLFPFADLWIHGHVHSRHDYTVKHEAGQTRVVCNARGHSRKGEAMDYNGQCLIEV